MASCRYRSPDTRTPHAAEAATASSPHATWRTPGRQPRPPRRARTNPQRPPRPRPRPRAAGLHVDARDEHGFNLTRAVFSSNLPWMVARVLAAGAQPNQRFGAESGRTPVMLVAHEGDAALPALEQHVARQAQTSFGCPAALQKSSKAPRHAACSGSADPDNNSAQFSSCPSVGQCSVFRRVVGDFLSRMKKIRGLSPTSSGPGEKERRETRWDTRRELADVGAQTVAALRESTRVLFSAKHVAVT